MPVTAVIKDKVPTLRAVSMDKGFYSPAKQEVLKPRLGGCLVLLIKRKLSQADKARESYPEFANLRKSRWRSYAQLAQQMRIIVICGAKNKKCCLRENHSH
jgi:hypothetical protein